MLDDHFYFALTAWATVLTALAAIGGSIYQAKVSQRAAALQMFIQVTKQFDEEPIASARKELAALLILPGQPPSEFFADAILDFFEGLAYLTRKGHVDYEMVSNDFSLPLRCYWKPLKPYVSQLRRDYKDPTFYEHLEWLNGKFVEEYAHERHKRPADVELTGAQLEDYFRSEINPFERTIPKN
jgi:hypothetical protein